MRKTILIPILYYVVSDIMYVNIGCRSKYATNTNPGLNGIKHTIKIEIICKVASLKKL